MDMPEMRQGDINAKLEMRPLRVRGRMNFRQELQAGRIRHTESSAYLAWVRSCECVCCGAPADDAHHRYGQGWIKGAGIKVSDLWTIPLCRNHHAELHASPQAWEERYGIQWFWICLQIERAVQEGVLTL